MTEESRVPAEDDRSPNTSEPVREARLRGHHFVCLQFFAGKGYSAEFVQNLSDVVERASSAPARLVRGADDVCAACPNLTDENRCADPDGGEMEVRRIDGLACATLGVAPGERLSLPDARRRLATRPQAVRLWRSGACEGCTWADICRPGLDALFDEDEPR